MIFDDQDPALVYQTDAYLSYDGPWAKSKSASTRKMKTRPLTIPFHVL